MANSCRGVTLEFWLRQEANEGSKKTGGRHPGEIGFDFGIGFVDRVASELYKWFKLIALLSGQAFLELVSFFIFFFLDRS